MEYEEAMRLQIEELIDEKTALRAQLMGKTTAEAIKMAFDNSDSYLESVMVRAKRAEAERDALAARVAELEGALGKFSESIKELRANYGDGLWNTGAGYVLKPAFANAESVLARTPAQSLAACKAAVLREAAKECQEVMPDDLPHLTYNQLMDMAERLEAEAANG